MSPPVTAILIGAGNRGYEAYGPYALERPNEIRFVAVAEPNKVRRERFAHAHNIPTENQFQSWEDCLATGQIADAAVVTTQDRLHVLPAITAMQSGYHVLLEKPMATSLAGCAQLVRVAEANDRILQICHVLRYTAFFSRLHDILESGRIGEIITVEHRENVTYWHMAHSFVRGHWRDSHTESPMILAKCCHDLDILYWNLGAPRRISSFGSLKYYRPENAPPGAPQRCTDGCPAAEECPWFAPRLYLDLIPLYHTAQHSAKAEERLGAKLALTPSPLTSSLRRLIPALDYRDWPISVISEDTSLEARLRALEEGPWGRCVYHCDNNVVDHQVVSMEMENGVSVAMTMQGFSHLECRTMRYEGSRATLRGRFAGGMNDTIEIHDHLSGRMEKIDLSGGRGGHGGGDSGLMAAFVRTLCGQDNAITNARASLESHLMAFAAEQARLEGRVIEMDSYRRQAEIASRNEP